MQEVVIFKTKEEAEAALSAIEEKIGKKWADLQEVTMVRYCFTHPCTDSDVNEIGGKVLMDIPHRHDKLKDDDKAVKVKKSSNE